MEKTATADIGQYAILNGALRWLLKSVKPLYKAMETVMTEELELQNTQKSDDHHHITLPWKLNCGNYKRCWLLFVQFTKGDALHQHVAPSKLYEE